METEYISVSSWHTRMGGHVTRVCTLGSQLCAQVVVCDSVRHIYSYETAPSSTQYTLMVVKK